VTATVCILSTDEETVNYRVGLPVQVELWHDLQMKPSIQWENSIHYASLGRSFLSLLRFSGYELTGYSLKRKCNIKIIIQPWMTGLRLHFAFRILAKLTPNAATVRSKALMILDRGYKSNLGYRSMPRILSILLFRVDGGLTRGRTPIKKSYRMRKVFTV